MSKFFTDSSNRHTFSLDKVVACNKGVRFSPKSPIRDNSGFFPTIEVTLASGGSFHNINLLYMMNDEEQRDLDFARLNCLLEDNS